MAFPVAALAAASLAASALGGSKNKGMTPSVQGFAAYPKEAQEYLVKELLPRMQSQGSKPFEAMPMQRAQNPAANPHASPELYKLQQYSDAVGGLFNPIGMGGMNGQAQAAPVPAQNQGGLSPQQLAAQYLQQTQGGTRAPATQLNTMLAQGRTSLGDIGDALLGTGYSGATPASNVNFEALYRALGM